MFTFIFQHLKKSAPARHRLYFVPNLDVISSAATHAQAFYHYRVVAFDEKSREFVEEVIPHVLHVGKKELQLSFGLSPAVASVLFATKRPA